MASDLERLIHVPGMRALSPDEVLARIDKFIAQCPGLTAVIIIGSEDSPEFIRCRASRNLPMPHAPRDRLRRSLAILDAKGALSGPVSPLL